jgi:tetratricopeptide (TPR) repeat protein
MQDLEETLQQALELGESEEWEAMATLLHEALESHPDNAEFLCWAGIAEREMGEEGIAYDLFRRSLEAAPEDPLILALAGNGVAAFDDPAAEAALRSAALMAPELPEARLFYGAYLAREGMSEEAMRELDAAKELDPEDPAVALERGVALALKGDPEAEMEFERAVSLDPEDGWARVLLGLALLEFGDPEEGVESAAEQLDAGARMRPDDVEAQFLAAVAMAVLGRDAAAWEMLERGRMTAVGTDLQVADAVEERIEGEEGAEEFLRTTLLPMAWHDRLMVRP